MMRKATDIVNYYSVKKLGCSVFFACLLTMWPLPTWAMLASPAWILLILIYWTLILPACIPIELAWCLGILLDVFQGSLLGAHAFAFTGVIYITQKFSHRLNMFRILQQSICIFFLVLLYQAILYCIQGFAGALPLNWIYWTSGLTSLLIWPWIVGVIGRGNTKAGMPWQTKF